MISVTDHATSAKGSPTDSGAVGVASRIPHTTITREKTWNIVNIRLDLTIPIATLTI